MSAQTLSTPEQIIPTNQNLTMEERRKMKKRLKREKQQVEKWQRAFGLKVGKTWSHLVHGRFQSILSPTTKGSRTPCA